MKRHLHALIRNREVANSRADLLHCEKNGRREDTLQTNDQTHQSCHLWGWLGKGLLYAFTQREREAIQFKLLNI